MAGPIDRFDDSAKRVLALAQTEAVRFRRRSIGPEHLLLGLLREGDNVAAPALTSSGVEGGPFSQAVAQLSGSGDASETPTTISLSSQTTRVIALATEEADQLGARHIGPEHLLLGLVREPGDAGSILRNLGVSTETIRENVMRGRRGD